jgi:phage-related protein
VDADESWDFYVDRKGTFESFEWTSPIDGETYNVRFMQDNLERSVLWKVLYNFGLDLIEVI